MSLLTEIQKLKGWHFLVGILAFLAVIGPGFLIIYRYHPELVEKYDIAKLLVFSSSLSIPVLFVNLIAMTGASTGDEKPDLRSELTLAALGTFGALYGGLFLSYLSGWSFISMLKAAAGIDFIFVMLGRIAYRVPSKKAPPAEHE